MIKSPNTITTVDLIRHGEPVGGHKYRGQSDDPLSEKGWTQMRSAVGEHRPWDVIASSTLSRCAAFASELAQRHAIPLEFDARLMEIGFGEWEGRTAAVAPGILNPSLRSPATCMDALVSPEAGCWKRPTLARPCAAEVTALDPALLRRFWLDPLNNVPPGAELLTAFRDRVIPAWDEILARHSGKHILIVGHAGVIRMVVRHVLDMPLQRVFRLAVPNAGITRIRVENDGEQILPTLLFHAGAL